MTTYSVIGTGTIGATIGRKAAAAGLQLTFGSRKATRDDLGAPAVGVAESIDGADVVLVAIPGAAVPALIAEHGAALAGRLVVDATNRMGAPTLNSADIFAGAPRVRYARAFSSLGVENFANPVFDDVIADLFYAADSDDRAAVEDLIRAVGLRPVAVGGASAAHIVDAAASLWFALALGEGHGRHLAFRTMGLHFS